MNDNKEPVDTEKTNGRKHIFTENDCEKCGSNEFWFNHINDEKYFLCVKCGTLYITKEDEK